MIKRLQPSALFFFTSLLSAWACECIAAAYITDRACNSGDRLDRRNANFDPLRKLCFTSPSPDARANRIRSLLWCVPRLRVACAAYVLPEITWDKSIGWSPSTQGLSRWTATEFIQTSLNFTWLIKYPIVDDRRTPQKCNGPQSRPVGLIHAVISSAQQHRALLINDVTLWSPRPTG